MLDQRTGATYAAAAIARAITAMPARCAWRERSPRIASTSRIAASTISARPTHVENTALYIACVPACTMPSSGLSSPEPCSMR